jgi:hypothetical protein
VLILYGGNFFEKVGQILFLGETGKLRNVIEPDIDDPRYA